MDPVQKARLFALQNRWLDAYSPDRGVSLNAVEEQQLLRHAEEQFDLEAMKKIFGIERPLRDDEVALLEAKGPRLIMLDGLIKAAELRNAMDAPATVLLALIHNYGGAVGRSVSHAARAALPVSRDSLDAWDVRDAHGFQLETLRRGLGFEPERSWDEYGQRFDASVSDGWLTQRLSREAARAPYRTKDVVRNNVKALAGMAVTAAVAMTMGPAALTSIGTLLAQPTTLAAVPALWAGLTTVSVPLGYTTASAVRSTMKDRAIARFEKSDGERAQTVADHVATYQQLQLDDREMTRRYETVKHAGTIEADAVSVSEVGQQLREMRAIGPAPSKDAINDITHDSSPTHETTSPKSGPDLDM